LILFSGLLPVARAQSTGADRDRGKEMLKAIKEDVKKYYYDPGFHGMDLDARFKQAEDKIKQATSNGQIMSIIAQVLSELNDSHTYFLPPARRARADYGWLMQMIGDKCVVVAVKPGSDAAARGLKLGDVVYSIDGYGPTRDNLWKMKYSYYLLKPRPGMRVVVQDADGSLRQVDLTAKVVDEKAREEELKKKEKEKKEKLEPLEGLRYREVGSDLIIYKLPEFDISDKQVDEMFQKIAQRKALILDLRGNPGGYESVLKRFTGYFFDHDIKIADLKGRKGEKPLIAKTRGADKVFKGQLVVLVDSSSASAAELFARVVQLEKRGVVIGDRTAGAVMRGTIFSYTYDRGALDSYILSFYGASITVADGIMADGKSLEHSGVVPDELLLPTSADLAAKRDPILARAAEVVGVNLDPAKAGALFPTERETAIGTEDKNNEEGDKQN
jgi:carboxyl-terminal processing protease